MNWHEKLGGRKFVLAVMVCAQTAALQWYAKIDAGVYSAVIMATVTGFFALNVWQKKSALPPGGTP